eukprot:382661_1
MAAHEDCFDPMGHTKAFTLSANNMVATTNEAFRATAYLSKEVKSGVHRWRFKILSYSNNAIDIGLWKSKYGIQLEKAARLMQKGKGKLYMYCVTYAYLSKGDLGDGRHDVDSYGTRCVKGDIIDMILDLNKLELKYVVNDKDYGVAFNVEKTSYKAVLNMSGYGYAIELVSYATTNNTESKETDEQLNCDNCDILSKETDDLRKQIYEMSSDMELNTGIINSLNEQIETVRKEKVELLQRYDEVNETNIKLNEECKELQTNLTEMTNKYNALFRKTNIDETNYTNWDAENVADWIINLDSKYEKYEETLRVKLNEEGVDGSLLPDLDKSDLHRFGITLLKDKNAILKQIKRVTDQKQQHHEQLVQYNEGADAPTAYI